MSSSAVDRQRADERGVPGGPRPHEQPDDADDGEHGDQPADPGATR